MRDQFHKFIGFKREEFRGKFFSEYMSGRKYHPAVVNDAISTLYYFADMPTPVIESFPSLRAMASAFKERSSRLRRTLLRKETTIEIAGELVVKDVFSDKMRKIAESENDLVSDIAYQRASDILMGDVGNSFASAHHNYWSDLCDVKALPAHRLIRHSIPAFGLYIVSLTHEICGQFADSGALQMTAVGQHRAFLNALRELALNTEFIYFGRDAVYIVEPFSHLKIDPDHRIHSEEGAAIQYSDGDSLYFWHGTPIPGSWIEESPTLEQCFTWENIEQRRCACEILGWDRVLREVNHSVINENDDETIGKLIEVDLPGIGRQRFLQVRCGTGRQFSLPVPPEMQTALQANAWTYGLDAEEYKPEVRT